MSELNRDGLTRPNDPAMTAYLASRDVMRRRNADWHEKPSRVNHGSYYFDESPYLTISTRRDNPGARLRRASHVSSVQSSASARAT